MYQHWREYRTLNHISAEDDFVPLSFVLPKEFSEFEIAARTSKCFWILKPANKSRSLGISVIHSLDEIPGRLKGEEPASSGEVPLWGRDTYVVSRYIDNPLLLSGKKFDLRVYVLVTSFHPLKAFIYKNGFSRFCTQNYSSDVSELKNLYRHITNTSFQEGAATKNLETKWTLDRLLSRLETFEGYDRKGTLWTKIKHIVFHSLSSVQDVIGTTKNLQCFQLFGYDILIDDKFAPWLLEVNGSPSLSVIDEADFVFKEKLIDLTLDMILEGGERAAKEFEEVSN
eukprot:TRINITY_DN5395_c0_g1_i3.p1 TRINITY_DN5395_c0_g1~~TRINITY_DN5395_c0_g1_i3.p1  ORF type:complete len:284 (+),score=59.00 TRINITY_DN5395_c0_g1_i3:1335-2186(+)